MKEAVRLATKAQAQAVREYLATLGVALTHTQALEVIARGQGMRSRHALAAQLDRTLSGQTVEDWVDANVQGNPVLMEAMKNYARAAEEREAPQKSTAHPYTVVSYRYTDGTNCKRDGRMVFRGRLTVAQLKLIQSRLDEGEYFVPAQVGFADLSFAFTDFGGDDHGWHILRLGEPEDWELDADSFVLRAGDVRQVFDVPAREYATDADCDNLMFRFARVMRWHPEIQEESRVAGAWAPGKTNGRSALKASPSAQQALQLAQSEAEAVDQLVSMLEENGFERCKAAANTAQRPMEWNRGASSNAYQFVIVERHAEAGLMLNFDVCSSAGDYLTETPMLAFDPEDGSLPHRLVHLLDEQIRQMRVDPAAWSKEAE